MPSEDQIERQAGPGGSGWLPPAGPSRNTLEVDVLERAIHWRRAHDEPAWADEYRQRADADLAAAVDALTASFLAPPPGVPDAQ